MGRRKMNRYRLETDGLKIEQSLPFNWVKYKSDTDIIRKILQKNDFINVLDSYDIGTREIKLVKIRDHSKGASQ